jgi:hypothetical protein
LLASRPLRTGRAPVQRIRLKPLQTLLAGRGPSPIALQRKRLAVAPLRRHRGGQPTRSRHEIGGYYRVAVGGVGDSSPKTCATRGQGRPRPLPPPEGACTLRTRSRRGRCFTRPGAAPASFSAADISALPPESVGHGSRVTQDHWEVSPLSWGVMSRGGPTPIRPATGRPSLPPRSFTRRPIGSPCGSLSLAGGRRAYHVPPMYRGWGGPQLFAGGATSACGEFGTPHPGHVPFGPSLSASLACSW